MLPECYSSNERRPVAVGFRGPGGGRRVEFVKSLASETSHTDASQSWVFCLNHGAFSQKAAGLTCFCVLVCRVWTRGGSCSSLEFLRDMLSWHETLLLTSYSSLCVCLCVRASLPTSSWPMASVGCSLSLSGLPLSHSRQLSGGSALPARLFFFPKSQKFEKS